MKKLSITVKRIAPLFLAASLALGALTGCEYSSVEDYLEDLGILDPYDREDETGTVADLEISTVNFEYDTDENNSQEEPEIQIAESDASQELSAEASAEALSQDEAKELLEEPGADPEIGNHADDEFVKGYKELKDSNTDSEVKAARTAMGLTENGIRELKNAQKGLYAYELLTDAGKTLYVEMLAILQNLGTDVTVSTTSDEAIEMVFDYVMADHPEIFYVDGYQYTNYSVGDTITRISFTGNYLYGADEVKRRQTRINEAVNKCLQGAPSSEDDYYAIKYVYEYLIANTEYDMDAVDNQNICSVFINGKSVCNGYAKAAQYLLGKLGIKSTLVTGTVNTRNSSGVRHAWNLVLCNNAYYYMDVTWGDASYQTVSGESADATKLPAVNYDYLNVTTSEITSNHAISDIMAMPKCNSIADNFYVRENEYFTSAEMALVTDLFNRRYKDGSNNVTIKCSNDGIYESLFEELITNRRVFECLQGDTSQVSYTTFEDTRTIIFWI